MLYGTSAGGGDFTSPRSERKELIHNYELGNDGNVYNCIYPIFLRGKVICLFFRPAID